MFEDMSDLDDRIVLQDENGDDVEFEFLDVIGFEDNEYILLLPLDTQDGLVLILRIEEGAGDEENYVPVEDNAILDKVFAIFKEKWQDELNFAD